MKLSRHGRLALVVGAPLVSIATLMVGLRIGGGSAVKAATVFASLPGAPVREGAPRPIAWQVLTYLEDRSVRETIPMRGIHVTARHGDKLSEWTGSSNGDGIAEAVLEIDAVDDKPIEVEVRADGESEPLARGSVTLDGSVNGAANDAAPAVRPSRRDGALGLDVYVEGERLVPGFETTLWVHATSSHGVELHLEPEAGLRVASDRARATCGEWTKVPVTAEGHVVGIGIDATDGAGKRGTWFGSLPVAAGAFFVDMPRALPASEPTSVSLVAPNPRTVVYAEIADEHGRAFAAALPVTSTTDHPVPRAELTIPPLASGLHWLVVSGEPRGGEHLGGAAIGKPFVVGHVDGVNATDECSIGPWLARRPARGVRRWLAVDGMETRGRVNRQRHRLGLVIGIGSLLAAAVLEVLLLTAAAREARAALLVADLDADETTRERMTKKTPGGTLAIALLVAVLGFALLAVLLIAKG